MKCQCTLVYVIMSRILFFMGGGGEGAERDSNKVVTTVNIKLSPVVFLFGMQQPC